MSSGINNPLKLTGDSPVAYPDSPRANFYFISGIQGGLQKGGGEEEVEEEEKRARAGSVNCTFLEITQYAWERIILC